MTTNRRELADKLEAATIQSAPPWQSSVKASDLTEAARLLREPVAGEVEAVELLRQFHTRIMMERRCGGLAVKVAQPIMEATEAFLRARLDAEGKGGEA